MTNNAKNTSTTQSEELKTLIDKGHEINKKPSAEATFVEDKRETARHEHTNHFTNRASGSSK